MDQQGAFRLGASLRIFGPGQQVGSRASGAGPDQGPVILLTNPRVGEQLFEFEPREVRRLLVGHHEMRYEIQNSIMYVLRLWHTREKR